MIPEVKQSRQLELIKVAVDTLSSSNASRGGYRRGLFRTEDSASETGMKTIRLSGSLQASKLIINSTLLMAWEAMAVPADRTPLEREQSFRLLIGVALKRGRRSRDTQRVGRAKAFDKERESKAVYALRG
jgi:hypothetical protein